MVRWQLTEVRGHLGPVPVLDALAGQAPVPDEAGQCRRVAGPDSRAGQEGLYDHLRPLLSAGKPSWVILPHGERERRHWWQGQLGANAEIGFGRGAVALAMSQLNRLGEPGRIAAVAGLQGSDPGMESAIALDWAPSDSGLAFQLTQMDGRLDGKTDVGALLEQGRKVLNQPEVLFCPGTGGEGYLERLLPFLSQLGDWASEAVRWEFAEAALGRMDVVGSLYTWAWLESGYRLGDWTGPGAVLEMDGSPLVGLSVFDWVDGGGMGWLDRGTASGSLAAPVPPAGGQA